MEINFDLHCDLTAYLAEPNTSADGDIRCSVSNLKNGNVKFQVMAFYSATKKGSVDEVKTQLSRYRDLLARNDIDEFNPEKFSLHNPKLSVIAAVENASGLCEEEMPIHLMRENLDNLLSNADLMYIGLTHHNENRFGGGNYSDIGLKDDGKQLLDYINHRKIGIDFSHTSDRLAYDVLNYIDQEDLEIPVLASHSNMRSVFAHPRNLPDELVKEIIRRDGLIGLNFVKYFVGEETAESIFKHIDYALQLGAENHLCFGADFFDDKVHPEQQKYPFFFEEMGDPSAYSWINEKVSENYSEEIKSKISHQNVLNYFARQQG